MKKFTVVIMMLLLILSGVVLAGAAKLPKVSSNQATSLIAEEIATLTYVREEEKLARDVYTFLSGIYPQARIFVNIAASEQIHMDAIKTLLERYGIDDPASTEAGVFSNPELQELYKSLTSQGQTSLVEAYKVGVAIEEMDIADLQEGIELSQHKDITTVYNNLLRGSKNHLAAFEYNL